MRWADIGRAVDAGRGVVEEPGVGPNPVEGHIPEPDNEVRV